MRLRKMFTSGYWRMFYVVLTIGALVAAAAATPGGGGD